MEDILIPIGICVVLPVMIVWLVNRTRQNETNRRTELMIKAIENGATLDLDLVKVQQKQKNAKTIKERLLKFLCGGCMATLFGIVALVLCCISAQERGSADPDTVRYIVVTGVCLSIGISLITTYIVGMKTLAKEIEAETKSLEQK